MKPVVQTDRNITSTLDGERIEMAFDANSLAHLQNLYINIYKDRELAVLREYSCNAYDAHVDAGISDPIEITLPTRLDPVLKITDHGIGMSLNDLRETYSKYGASTKRDSNDVIGSFGIGCKSALTYTDQFTVRARKNGREVIVSVSRNAKGIGELTVAHEGDTQEANGVEITIPTPGFTEFAAKAAKFFQYWPEGSVLVDGQEPKRFEGKQLLPGIYLKAYDGSYYHNEKSVVVMGNVPYPVEHQDFGLDFTDNLSYANSYHQVVAFVPIGTVEPVPAREGLTTTSANRTALLEIGQKIKDNVADLIQTEIDKADSMLDAIKVIFEIKAHYPRVFWPKDWTYQGDVIPDEVAAVKEIVVEDYRGADGYIPIEKRKQVGGFVLVRQSDSGKQHTRVKGLGWKQLTEGIYLTGFDLDRFTPSHRRRLDQWIDDRYDVENPTDYDLAPTKAHLYILTETLPDSVLIDQTRIYDWEDVRNTKLPSNRQSGSGLTGAYDTLDFNPTRQFAGTKLTQAADIDKTKPIYFYCELETRRFDNHGYKREKSRAEYAEPYAQLILEAHPNAQFFCLPPNRRAKFERDFPTAIEMRDELRVQAQQWVSTLTKRQRKQLAVHEQKLTCSYTSLLPIKDRIKDPELREYVQLMATDTSSLVATATKFRRYVLNFYDDVLKLEPVERFIDRYPLVDSYSGVKNEFKDHVSLYLNAAYETFYTTQGA